MDNFLKRREKILSIIILSLLLIAAYIPTFSGEFILDDRPFVKDNQYIRKFHSLSSYLSQEDGIIDYCGDYHSGYYRPLVNFFYTVDLKIWGVKASGFRTTNLILHILTSLMLYKTISIFFNSRLVPFLVALLFGLHPVNTESVAWITSRNNILVTLFSLISFYYYLKNSKKKNIYAGLLSYLSFMAALFCKEFAIMLLPIFFLYNRLMVENRKILKEEILGYIPFILILFFYFILRANVIGSLLIPVSAPNLWKNIYFIPFLLIYNLKLVIFPYGLHSFIIHYPPTYLGWQAFAGFIGLGFLFFFLWKKREIKILLFSFLSFLIGIFPVLNIIPGSTVTLISMRWLYFPAVFLSFCAAWYIEKFLRINRQLFLCIVIPIVIYFGSYSYILNQNLWHDEDTFFRQEVLRFDNHLYARGLAELFLEDKNYQDAERYFMIAIKDYPKEVSNYINYAALLIETGRPEDALSYMSKARSLTKTYKQNGELFNNMGAAYFALKKREEAIENFLKAVKFCPDDASFWANLGGAYVSIGNYRESISALKKGLHIAPESIQLRKTLALTYLRMGNPSQAISVLEKIPFQKRDEQGINQLLDKARKSLKD